MSGAPIQRTVDAATAPRVQTAAPNSVFNLRPADDAHLVDAIVEAAQTVTAATLSHSPPGVTLGGLTWGPGGRDAGQADAATTDHHEETPDMPKAIKPPRPRRSLKTQGASARFQICALLMAKGDLARDDLLAEVSADKNAIYQAFHAAKKAGHIVFLDKTDKWHITDAGREWTSGGANLEHQQSAGTSPRHVKRGRRSPTEKGSKLSKPEQKRLGVIEVTAAGKPKQRRKPLRVAVADIVIADTKPAPLAMPRSFRCAVYSDGGFMLAKGETRIELDADEHAGMLRYLERMAEEQASA